ncbi:hypothetical protein [Candidatus Poriferisocius sp.]|uniref:hypothetical protein n=1 Tax=Candidatus Poriferisocius sp. TaxID=3101276 RepID=UPI003B5B0A64
MRKAEEEEALGVLRQWGDVDEYEWQERPDLWVRLKTGREVGVEVTQHTYDAKHHLFTVDGKEHSSSELAHRWVVWISDPAASDPSKRKSRSISSLVKETLIPLLADVESTGSPLRTMQARAQIYLEHAVERFDASGPEGMARSVDVLPPVPVGYGQGLVKTKVRTGHGMFLEGDDGFYLEGVDHLVSAVQGCVDAKHVKCNQYEYPTDWLVVALDGSRASEQLDEACQRVLGGHEAQYADFHKRVNLRRFEEVWVFARSFGNGYHVALRMTDASSEWRKVVQVPFRG